MTAEIANSDTYALFAVQMAEDGNTRAYDPVTSTIESEYIVHHGKVLIFKAAETNPTEKNATFVESAAMSATWTPTASGEADVSRKAYLQVGFPKNTFEAGKNYYACIVLNAPSDYKWPTSGQTFGAWSTTAQPVDFIYEEGGKKYTTMVSSPRYSKNESIAGLGKYPVLAPITSANIKDSFEKLTKENAVKDVYVHRNAVKISLLAHNDEGHVFEIKNTGTSYDGATVTIENWAPDVMAAKSFPIQNVDGLDLSAPHMHGHNGIRCHWGKAAYYNATTTTYGTDFKKYKFPSEFEDYAYVKENTMDYKYQIENRTTSVVLKAVYKKGETATTLCKFGEVAQLYTKDDAETMIETAAKKVIAAATVTLNPKDGGKYPLSELFTIKNGEDPFTPAQYTLVAEELGMAATDKISYYKNGECYYRILIRHFDNAEVPLSAEELTALRKENGGYQAKHLGRYGVLRNNWYEITVSTISRIGEPSVPDPTDDPDDKEKKDVQAVGFDIKMLNWAKRSQTAPL